MRIIEIEELALLILGALAIGSRDQKEKIDLYIYIYLSAVSANRKYLYIYIDNVYLYIYIYLSIRNISDPRVIRASLMPPRTAGIPPPDLCSLQ